MEPPGVKRDDECYVQLTIVKRVIATPSKFCEAHCGALRDVSYIN